LSPLAPEQPVTIRVNPSRNAVEILDMTQICTP